MSGALLRVPSGLLVASGWEYVRPGDDEQPDFEIPEASRCWSTARIPPGDYLVEAFEIEWGSEPDHRLRELTTRGERVVGGLFTALVVIDLCSVLALPLVFLVTWFEGSLATAWRALKIMLLMHAAYWPVAVPVLVVVTRTRAWRHHRETEARVAEEYPGYTVVCLRRRRGEREFVSGRFGPAHVEPSRPASWDVQDPTEPRWKRWPNTVLSLLIVLLFLAVAFVIALIMSFAQDPPW